MTQIDFYLLPHDGSLTVQMAVGRIAEKALSRGHQIFVQVQDEQRGRLRAARPPDSFGNFYRTVRTVSTRSFFFTLKLNAELADCT